MNKIDLVFFDLLINLYKPFLSARYKKATIQYTVFSKNEYKYPIWIIALFKTKSKGIFLEIALIPFLQNKNYGYEIIKIFLKKYSFDKIGWTVHKANLPSIKLLKKLQWGFFERTVNNKKRIEAEGFFRPNNDVSKKMKDSLIFLIPESEVKFKKWVKEYKKRKKELLELTNFLKKFEKDKNWIIC